MPSEAVEIIIEADDKATPKIDAAVDNIDAKVKRIKEVGQQAKASTEIISSVASVAGGSQLASALGPLAGLIEKIGAFSEVSKAGGAGAMAFKAGIAGIVAVGAFKLGSAIGDLVFETDRWTKALERANEEQIRLRAEAMKIAGSNFKIKFEEIQLINPELQQQKFRDVVSTIDREISQLQSSIENRTRQNETWAAYFKSFVMSLETTEDDKQRLDLLRQQREELQAALNPRLQALELGKELTRELKSQRDSAEAYLLDLQDEIDLLNAVNDAERIRIETNKRFGGVDAETRDRIEALMSEKMELEDIAKAEREAEAEAKRRADEAERNQQRINDLRQSELDKLEEQRILLTKGKEAAKAFALQKQGLSEIDANRIAREQAAIDKLRDNKSPELQATEGRLMTRGRTVDPMERQLRFSERTAKAVEELNKKTKLNGNTIPIERVVL